MFRQNRLTLLKCARAHSRTFAQISAHVGTYEHSGAHLRTSLQCANSKLSDVIKSTTLLTTLAHHYYKACSKQTCWASCHNCGACSRAQFSMYSWELIFLCMIILLLPLLVISDTVSQSGKSLLAGGRQRIDI